MKKVTGLNDRLEHYEDIPRDAELMLPTVRQVLIKQVATAAGKPDEPEDTITLYELGVKLKKAPLDFLEIEDADFKLLAAAVRRNSAQFVTHYQGQMLQKLKAWEKPDDGGAK